MDRLYRQKFRTLCRAVRARNAALLEFQAIESGNTTVAICAVNRLPSGETEYVPLARMFDRPVDRVILPGPNAPVVRAEWA